MAPARLGRLVVALALALPAPALAQPVPPARHAQAEEQFKLGREAQTKGDCRRALELFRASHAAEPGRGKLVNIAICEKDVGLLASALRHFEEVLPQLKGDDRAPIVEKHLAELRPRVPVLRLDPAPGAPAVTVKIDGEAAQVGAEILLDPGKHTILVSASGRADGRQEVELKPQERRTVRVELGALLSTPEGAPAKPDEERPAMGNGRRLAGFVIGGAGAAALVVGVGTGIASILAHGSAVSACPTHTGCPQSVLDTASRGRALAVASTATFVTGALLAGAGVALVVTSGGAKAQPAAGLVLLPGGARVEGRF